jgi:hypothetical protein
MVNARTNPDWHHASEGKVIQGQLDWYTTILTEISQPCVYTYDGLFICQLYSLPDLLEETDCKEDMPLTSPLCIVRLLLTVDNSDMN